MRDSAWQTQRLGDVGDALIGLTYSPSQIDDGGVLVLRSSNIQEGRLSLDDTVRVRASIPNVIRVRRSDILICVRNGSRALIGKSLYLDERLEGETFGAFMAVFRSRINDYLRFWFQSDDFKRQVDQHLGATINQITNKSLKGFVAPIPSARERQRTVERLADADSLVESLEQLIVKKRAMKQGLMQELLAGRTRLAGFSTPWEQRRLGDLLTYEQPGPYLVSSTDYVGNGTPVLTAGRTFLLGYTADRHGIYGAVPVIIFDDFTTASKYVDFPFKAKSSAMKMLSARPGVCLRYIYERMQLIDFVAVDHKRRWITEYSKLEVGTPDFDEQEAIASVLDDADSEIRALQDRLEKAQAVKTGMMQELLSGRTRPPVETLS